MSLAVGIAPQAQAAGPDAATGAVNQLLTRLANDFLPDVASSTALSQQLPTLAVTPAESVDLRNAFKDLVKPGGRLEDIGTKETLAELRTYIAAADGGGWTFETGLTGNALTVDFERTVTDDDAALDIHDQDGTISLSTGGGISVTGKLTGSFTFTYDSSAGQAVLTSPSLSIATTADLPDGKELEAGLGILGVKVVGSAGSADYALSSTVHTAWANPDNDAAGSLAFDNPGTAAADDGELAAKGAATGIVTTTRTGSLGGHLVATPRNTGVVAGLPDVGATIDLSSVSPASFDAPTVTSSVPDAAKPFLTLTPRDLAAGLSQAASAVLGMQNAEDGRLPLMRGSVANAVDAVGGIKEFLADQVPDADPTDKTPGQPKFASLQDMLTALDAASYGSGWSIDVLGGAEQATFDPATKKVGFTIRTTRSKDDLELNVLGAATSGTATYSATGLNATGVDFDGPKDDQADELVGRKVTAGGSYGTIASVDGEHALTLTDDGWVNGQPANGTAFSVEAADPKTGAPELANSLEATTGISNANAEVSTAQVSPDVTLTLPMALDLRAPQTYAADPTKPDCNPDPAVESPCPFKQVDASGLARVITSLPLAADRVLLRQSPRDVLVADAAITSPVQIQATSGYLALSIGGELDLTSPSGDLQKLALTKTGDVAIPAFVEQVRQQAVSDDAADDVFTQTLGGTVAGDLDITVDDAPDAFADGEDSTKVTVSADVADLADGIDAGEVTVTPASAERADLLKALNFEPNNPTSLYGGVREAFKKAGSDLTTMTGGGLDVPIPFVGSSVGQLIGAGASGAQGTTYTQVAAVPAAGGSPAIPATTKLSDPSASFTEAFIGRQIVIGSTLATIVDQTGTSLTLAPQLTSKPADDTPYLVENELLGAVHALSALTPATLQGALAMAQKSLGNGSSIDFGLVKDGSPQLRLDLEWKRDYEISQPVSLEFGDQQLVGASTGGEITLGVDGTVKLRLFLPLSASAMLDPAASTKIDADESSVQLGATLEMANAHLGANVGPLSVDLGKAPGNLGNLKAGFGVKASSKAAGKTTLGSFFGSGFGVSLTNGGACAGAQVLCATFPMFVNGSSVPGGPLLVTSEIPANLTSLKQVFEDGTTVTPPSGLQTLIDGEPFNFDSLAEGLQQYLFYTETALRTASNNGEMPVIGKDLQAGADFMGDTRAKLDTFLEEQGDVSTVGPAKAWLTTQLADALGTSINGPTGIQVNFTCKVVLEPPAAPTGTPENAVEADTTKYVYKVAALYSHGADPVKRSKPSGASAVVTNAATLTAGASGKFNTVTWEKAPGANGYEILRATQTGDTAPADSAYKLAGTVGNVLTFDDHNAAPGNATIETSNPLLPGDICPDEASVTQVEGFTLGLKLGQGKISAAKGCEDDDPETGRGKCLGAKLPVDLGIPGLSLKTGDSGSVSGKVGWALDVNVGVSRSQGFYVDTTDVDELEVGAALKLDKAASAPDLKAQLAIINVDVNKNGDKSEFSGHFGIDLKAPGNALTLASMKATRVADAIEVSVEANVDIDWHLAANVTSALPGISTDFKLTWGWGASTSKTPSNPEGLKVRFDHVTLDTGDFFGKALKPYLQQVLDATKPLQPVIDTIFTPMPVISDLSKAAGGQEITIATLAETFSTIAGGPKIKPFLEAIKTTNDFFKNIKCEGNGCGVEIGSFDLSKKRVASTTVSAGNASSMIDKDTPGAYAPKPKAETAAAIANKDSSGRMSSTAKRLASGLSFPVLDDPTILFELISGGDIPLVEFDSGPLTLGFQFQKSFGPIYAPPPVMMVIGGGASVSMRIAAGFDTYGIRRAIETGEGAQVLDSLYFKTVDKNGTPIPVVQFTGYLEAGASVSIGVLEVGVVGGIKLTVGFYWNDPNNDGKFRLFEFGAAVANNPICLFNVGGELSLYIKVFVTIGFSPFSVSFDFTLINIKLLDFNLKPDCSPPPPRLGGTKDGVLYVFAGKLGRAAQRGHAAWDNNNDKNESFVVRQVPAYSDDEGDHEPSVDVRGLGITESFPDKAGSPITAVVVDGRGYQGSMTVTFTGGSAPVEGAKPVSFTKKAVVFGGNGDDIIRTGEGDSWVDGGPGADNIVTLDRQDLSTAPTSVEAHVAGGPGKDTITVGNGKDTVAGDASLRFAQVSPTVDLAPVKAGTVGLSNVVSVSGLQDPADADLFDAHIDDAGDDQIAAGLGSVTLSGNGGVDTIGTANDSQLADSAEIKGTSEEPKYRGHASVLVGGAGGDVMKSGSANDKLYTGDKKDIDEFADGSGDAATDRNTVDTGAGSDTVHGSNGIDFVTTHSTASQKAIVYGGAADDVLTGGQGSDEIYGGPGNDYVVATPATVGDPGSASDVLGSARAVGVLPGASTSTKLLVGGTGSDRIYGSDGPSTIFGDTTTDKCDVQSDPVSKQPKESNVAGDAADLILGGNGVDVVNAGGGEDWAYTSGSADRVCGNSGADHLYAGDGDDLVQGGSGADQAYGETGSDQVYGNEGNDALYGAAGTDRLQGNAGSDWLDGGSEADVLLGGTSKAGSADTADTLLGAGGADRIVGDNAQTDVMASSPYPTDLGSGDGSLGGGDYIVAGDDDDTSFGGLGDDTTYAGNGADYAEGNNGGDTTHGEAGDDDLIGGSSQLASSPETGRPDAADKLFGGAGQDVIAGDNATVARGLGGHPVMAGHVTVPRSVDLAEEVAGDASGRFGGDTISGGDDNDVVFAQRGNDSVSLGDGADYGEGGQDVDTVDGDGGDDDVVGGSYTPLTGSGLTGKGQPDGGDTLTGGTGEDVVLGDDGALTRIVAAPGTPGIMAMVNGLTGTLTANRVAAQRSIAPYDLGDSPVAQASGPDTITGGGDNDVLLGQGGDDSVDGGTEADYAEGGQGSDLVKGGAGDDDVVGGSSTSTSTSGLALGQPDAADNVYGGPGDDVAIGDNGMLTRVLAGRDWRTNRANPGQSALVPGRGITLYDLKGALPTAANATPVAGHSAADAISGQGGVDVILGQDGDDRISGGGDDDYAEGQGGADKLHGDVPLVLAELVTPAASAAWAAQVADVSAYVAGQDDLTGGWSTAAYRDGVDEIHGDGDDDFVVGDNGSVARVLDGNVERVYSQRYGAQRTGHAKVRVAGGGATSTRFCPVSGSGASATCEVVGAYGGDLLFGDDGQDVVYGQDGNDVVRGGAGDDDLYGELGDDSLFGEAGEDAILGDRGGVQNRYEDGSRSRSKSLNMPPAVTYTSRRAGTVSRETDLLHDVNGADLVGSGATGKMPLDGVAFGGKDRIRGGDDNDAIHGGAGDDLANGDQGGDSLFGDGGKDVMWGGMGRACAAADAECQADPGTKGEFIDHLFGGKDDDVLDWRPRGSYGPSPARTCSTGTDPVTTKKDGTFDPCSWFEMTGRDNDTGTVATAADNQHHQGIDWIYGGWDRDVMQGDQTANGPNPGDRLFDWNGVYNLYSHCNAAYGGFNDLRAPAPDILDFAQQWAVGQGAGRPGAGVVAADVMTSGTSAFEELALVYTQDKSHSAGSAYPTTPGHFDDANACNVY